MGKIVSLRGKVTIERGSSRLAARVNSAVQAGDTIKTGADSRVKVQLKDRNTITLAEKSKATVKDFLGPKRMKDSRAFTRILGLEGEIAVSSATPGVSGTVTVTPGTEVMVREGEGPTSPVPASPEEIELAREIALIDGEAPATKSSGERHLTDKARASHCADTISTQYFRWPIGETDPKDDHKL